MIGEMKDRLTVKKKIKKSNGRGGWTLEEFELGTFWAFVEPLTMRQTVNFRQVELNTNTKIVMRLNTAIDKECVFYGRGQKYTLEEIIEKDGFYHIMAVGENVG